MLTTAKLLILKAILPQQRERSRKRKRSACQKRYFPMIAAGNVPVDRLDLASPLRRLFSGQSYPMLRFIFSTLRLTISQMIIQISAKATTNSTVNSPIACQVNGSQPFTR